MGNLEWVQRRLEILSFVVARLVWENLLNVSRLKQEEEENSTEWEHEEAEEKKVFPLNVRDCSRVAITINQPNSLN